MITHRKARSQASKVVTLKSVAQHVGLSAGTVSAVLNNSAASHSIPQRTKNRVIAAAREMNYRPNFFAQSLRRKHTDTIGVIAEEIGDSYSSLVICGIEQRLKERGYFFLTVAHRHDPTLLAVYSAMLMARGVEGFITVDTILEDAPLLPTVAVAGHKKYDGVTNIVLDHERAAFASVRHLMEFGHKKIAFMKGHPTSSDAEDRWNATRKAADQLGIEMDPELIVQIDGLDSSPQLGVPCAKQLLARNKPFTALLAYNDISAIGALRVFQGEGLNVPQDVSVVGFDDIEPAAFCTPGLTTVRQPLMKMGEIAAQTLLERIAGKENCPSEIAIEPELVVRESTTKVRSD